MLYHLLYPLHTSYSFFNVFRYISLRTIYAALTALLISLILGPWLIKKLSSQNVAQPIRRNGPSSHLDKKGTPTLGGILILFAVGTSTLLWANLTNFYIRLALLVTFSFGLIGFIDDYIKLIKNNPQGLKGRYKLGGQLMIALSVGTLLYYHPLFPTQLTLPFFKKVTPDLGYFYVLFAMLIIVGASNAVNLTDGLDGLAIGPITIASATYLLFAYMAGHIKIANYLQITYVFGAGELAIFCGAIIGAGMGFLWYNTYPAQIFMGDVGSLAMGGALGTIAIIAKQEILLIIVGGIFVVETLSVIFQVFYYKITNGKRIFRMAPLHHHFELKGWAEPKIIVRFWIISIFLALIAISTLKLR